MADNVELPIDAQLRDVVMRGRREHGRRRRANDLRLWVRTKLFERIEAAEVEGDRYVIITEEDALKLVDDIDELGAALRAIDGLMVSNRLHSLGGGLIVEWRV